MSRTRNHSCSCWMCSPDERRAKFRDEKRMVDDPKDLIPEDEFYYCGDGGYFCEDCSKAIDEENAAKTEEYVLVHSTMNPEEFERLLDKVHSDLALEMAILAPYDTHETFPPPDKETLEAIDQVMKSAMVGGVFDSELFKKLWDTPEEDEAWKDL